MAEITDEQMRALHEAGVPLSRSWVTYAQPELKSRWSDLQRQSASDAFAKGIEAAHALDGDGFTKLTQAFAGPQAILTARDKLRATLKANILSYIANGHLHGFGYELPRHTVSTPIAIPKSAWAGKCDWKEGTLSFRGLEFVDVRLTTNRIRNEILERGQVDLTPARAVGRPTVANDILAAIHALHEAGEIDPEQSQRSHFPKAIHWLELHRPDIDPPPNAIVYETFRRYFAPFFKELKKNKKQ